MDLSALIGTSLGAPVVIRKLLVNQTGVVHALASSEGRDLFVEALITHNQESLNQASQRAERLAGFDERLLLVPNRWGVGAEGFWAATALPDSKRFEGQELLSHLPVCEDVAFGIANDLATSLEALHEERLPHGAIVPSAVVLLPRASARLRAHLRACVLGPWLNEQCSKSRDLFDLGTLLFSLLSGVLVLPDGAHLQDFAPWVEPTLVRAVHGLLLTKTQNDCPSIDAFLEVIMPIIRRLQPITEESLHKPPATTNKAQRVELPKFWSEVESAATEKDTTDGQSGALLAERFRLIKRLGVGGMGAVYEALDNANADEHVAVKLIRPEVLERSWAARRRFVREGRATMAIQSEHVVKIIDAGEDESLGVPYLAMELLRGRDLREIIKKCAPLDIQTSARIFIQACKGLSAAHKKGIIHRDIKPSNLFLADSSSGDITVKVCDFGIAKMVSDHDTHSTMELTNTGHVVGSPGYMSPEQSTSSRQVDHRADIWSLCVTLYECLSAKHPWWQFHASAQALASKLALEPPALQSIAPWVPPTLAAIVHKGLAQDRNSRWQSMDELEAALGEFGGATSSLTPESIHSVPLDIQKSYGAEPSTRDEMSSTPAHSSGGATVLSVAGKDLPDFKGHAADQARAQLNRDENTVASIRRPTDNSRAKRTQWVTLALGLLTIPLALYWYNAPSSRLNSSPVASVSSHQTTCSSRSQCVVKLGPGALCRSDNTCAIVENDDCRILGTSPSETTIPPFTFGLMFPLKGPDAESLGIANVRAAELAVREFNETTGGVETIFEGKPVNRALELVVCDDSANPEKVATHLVEEVKVPAVIGFHTSNEVIDLSRRLFLPNNVLTIASINTGDMVTKVSQPPGSRLVWRTAVNAGQGAVPMAALVQQILEPRIRSELPKKDVDLRVALVRIDKQGAGISVFESLVENLVFNGRSVGENHGNFRDFRFGDGAKSDLKNDTDAIAQALIDYAPHIILIPQIDDFALKTFVEPLEAKWPSPNRFRPYYVNRGALDASRIANFFSADPSRTKRFISITLPSFLPPAVKFIHAYNSAFKTNIAVTDAPSAPYDAVYLLAYAAFVAQSNGTITGPALARAIEQLLPPGKPLDAGPGNILDAFDVLRRGEKIDLQGAFGRMDFDPKTGESPADFVVLCPVMRGKSSFENIEAGLVYSAISKKIEGQWRCH